MTELDISEAMRSHAQASILWAREVFETHLDYSEESLHEVERILGRLRDRLPKGLVSNLFNRAAVKQEIAEISIVWGSYLGEVIRHQKGGEWRLGSPSATDRAMVLTIQGITLSPIETVYKRLTTGAAADICHYYGTVQQMLKSASIS